MEILTLFIAVFGALAWTPWIYEKFFNKPRLEVRLLGLHANSMDYSGRQCLVWFVAMNIVSLRKDFNIKDVDVSALFEGADEYLPGHVVWMRPDLSRWVGPETPPNQYRLAIKAEDTLPYVGSLPKNQTKTVYLLFEISNLELAPIPIEKLSVEFTEQTGLVQKIDMEIGQADSEHLIWDDRIWQQI